MISFSLDSQMYNIYAIHLTAIQCDSQIDVDTYIIWGRKT